MSRIVIPPAYKLMIMSDSPPTRRFPFGTSRGSKLPSRSRGVASSRSPISLPSRLGYTRSGSYPSRDRPGHASHNPDGRSARPANQPPGLVSPAPAETRRPRSAADPRYRPGSSNRPASPPGPSSPPPPGRSPAGQTPVRTPPASHVLIPQHPSSVLTSIGVFTQTT